MSFILAFASTGSSKEIMTEVTVTNQHVNTVFKDRYSQDGVLMISVQMITEEMDLLTAMATNMIQSHVAKMNNPNSRNHENKL